MKSLETLKYTMNYPILQQVQNVGVLFLKKNQVKVNVNGFILPYLCEYSEAIYITTKMFVARYCSQLSGKRIPKKGTCK